MFLLFRLCYKWGFFLIYIAIFFLITSQFLFLHFDLRSSRTATKHTVLSTRGTSTEFKLVKKWLAFLKLYVCIYLGVDIIMFLWYSSCWVWNAGVSKARRRSQTKAWMEVRISVPLTGGSWERNDFVELLIFIKQWAYVYRNVFSKNIPNVWFFFWCSDFTRAGRSLLQALGSLVRMVFKYKAVMRAALNHVFYLLVFLVSWSRGHTLTFQLCLCNASVFSVQCVSLHCVELSRDFFVKDWNVFV